MPVRNKNSQRGVSLVELSVSITIIGILIAGTLGGASLLKAAKLRRVATEFTDYQKAIAEFEAAYNYLPGDLPNASSFWSTASIGDGNGSINWDGNAAGNQEDLYVWQHLGLAKLVGGTFTGAVKTAPTVRYEPDTNAPSSEAFNNMIYSVYNLTSTVYSRLGTVIKASSLSTSGLPNTGGLTAKDAYSVDMKLDDGNPSSGNVYVYRESTASGCVADAITAASTTFNLSSDATTCQLLYFYRQAPRN